MSLLPCTAASLKKMLPLVLLHRKVASMATSDPFPQQFVQQQLHKLMATHLATQF